MKVKLIHFWMLIVLLMCSYSSYAWSSPKTLRYALLIGHNKAGGRVADLRYAENDARKVKELLVKVAGYPRQNIWMQLGKPASIVTRTMGEIRRKLLEVRQRVGTKSRIILFVYYSGHALKGKLLLGQSSLRFQMLKTFMKETQASLRFAVIDACESGSMTKLKGLRRTKESFRFPSVRLTPTTKGEVIITATGNKESAHEDSRLKGGIFTHYFLSGLRGAADHNHDGFVTLEEAYTYSYNRSLERTILSRQGPQRARFSKKLTGYGSLVLTSLSKQKAFLQLQKNVVGDFFVWNKTRDYLVAEVVKNRGKHSIVMLSPGQYVLQWRHKQGLYNQQISLKKGERFLLKKTGERLAYQRVGQTKGGRSIEKPWTPFRGQLQGVGLAASYKIGTSGLDQALMHQGASLSLLIPLKTSLSTPMSLVVQGNYQFGNAKIKDNLLYNLHVAEVDVGLMWTLLERPFVWIGTGFLLRASAFFHVLFPEEQRNKETLLSFAGGAGSLTSFQFGFGERFFVQLSLFVGARLFNLGGNIAVRWDVDSSLGLGVRF